SDCGVTTPSVRWMPTTPRTEYGAVTGWPSSVSCAPVGLAAMLIVAVCGVMSRSTVVVAPPGSLTVSRMRYQTLAETSPMVGITTDPDLDPVVGCMNGCVWVSWWNTISQVNPLAATSPVSGSVPEPEYVIVIPPWYVVPAVGVMMVAEGGSLFATVSVALLLVALPNPFVTTQLNVAPLSA